VSQVIGDGPFKIINRRDQPRFQPAAFLHLRGLLLRAIAYRLQKKAFAGLKPSTHRVLDRIADNRSKDAAQYIPQRRASAGTVLIREWRGVSHRVTVLDHEVVYRDRRYKSLSEVARAITGSRWSGPLFFGLKGRLKEAVNG
jgi:hypothetical protein